MFDIRMRRFGVLLVLTISIVFSLRNPNAETQRRRNFSFQEQPQIQEELHTNDLQYDFYSETCPQAERIIRTTMEELYEANSNISPQLLRLLFHDCFVGGCDASVLLDENDDGTTQTEKQTDPDKTLKGFIEIDTIKSRLEVACPATVSCSDTLVLATREGVLLAGGPYYPLFTGRKDSSKSYHDEVVQKIPSPNSNIDRTLEAFKSEGFNEQEIVSLLGAHSIGKIDCTFIGDRITNFNGSGQPDPSLELDFLNDLRNTCIVGASNETGIDAMYYQGLASVPSGNGFDNHFYKNLLRGRGLLVSDQQLMADEKTATLVSDYASDDGSAFRRDFARAMVKLSDLNVLSGSQGIVRSKCSKLLPQLVG